MVVLCTVKLKDNYESWLENSLKLRFSNIVHVRQYEVKLLKRKTSVHEVHKLRWPLDILLYDVPREQP